MFDYKHCGHKKTFFTEDKLNYLVGHMETVNISFDLSSSDYLCNLDLEVCYNNKTMFQVNHVNTLIPVSFPINLSADVEHTLQFIMKNKTFEHTILNANNEIIKDAYLNINNFTINSVELGETFYKTCVYLHDFNGTEEPIKDEFYGDIGCNGTVQFVFQSPIYLWLVTNM